MESQVLSNLVNILAIILSIVSLIITIIGFFASLRFYRDGVNLQNLANDVLVRIEEKALSIQTQIGGMFDKTLDAAIGKSEKLDSSFEALNTQLEESAKAILDVTQKKIGAIGEEERKKLESVVEKQMSNVRKQIETTRDFATEFVELSPNENKSSTLQNQVLVLLRKSSKPLTYTEVAESLRLSKNTAVVLMRRLHQLGIIKKVDTGNGPGFTINF